MSVTLLAQLGAPVSNTGVSAAVKLTSWAGNATNVLLEPTLSLQLAAEVVNVTHLTCTSQLIDHSFILFITDCGCNVNGSENEFCNILGQCSCHPGVSDLDCGSCADGYFNFVAGVGCTECACNTNASISNVCNDVGVCPCQSGVGGDKCDSCLPEHFNYPECRSV